MELPPHLIDQIAAGRCVAFVGAGFSAPAVPSWTGLLQGLARRAGLDADNADWIARLLDSGSSRDLEAAAQIVQGAMGSSFMAALEEVLGERGDESLIAERRRLLVGIPFDAILTTNFDPFLRGEVPSPDVYQRVLRDPPHRWWEPRFWDGAPGAPIVKLHGEVGPIGGEVVFTQRDYRERLYSSSAYMTFLRSIFATNTILFLGVSFTDAYLNELRSEVLAMFDHETSDDPVAYALLPDVAPHQMKYLRAHEGLGVLGFDTMDGADWSGFEAILRGLHDATNPRALLGRAIAGATILWVDAQRGDTSYGSKVLATAAADSGGSTTVVRAASNDEAAECLRARNVDLVIVDWPLARDLLATMRREDLRAAALVYGESPSSPDRTAALSLGATEAVSTWGDLFREVTRVLGSDPRRA